MIRNNKLVEKIAQKAVEFIANCSQNEFNRIHRWLSALANALPAIRAKERKEEMSEENERALDRWNKAYSNNITFSLEGSMKGNVWIKMTDNITDDEPVRITSEYTFHAKGEKSKTTSEKK